MVMIIKFKRAQSGVHFFSFYFVILQVAKFKLRLWRVRFSRALISNDPQLNYHILLFYQLFCAVQVNFLTKLVALRPGKDLEEIIKNVMQGKDEGADRSGGEDGDSTGGRISAGIRGRVSCSSVVGLYISRLVQ